MKTILLLLASLAQGADLRTMPPAAPADCKRIKEAHRNTYEASHRAWGWKKKNLSGPELMMPFFIENAQKYAKRDLRGLDAFVSMPPNVADSANPQPADCSRLQAKARELRPQLAQYSHLLEASEPFCAKPNQVVGGECGATLGRALELGGKLRQGPVREFQQARAHAPNACKNVTMNLIELSVPPCERAAGRGGPLCDQLDVAGTRKRMATASHELNRIKDRDLKLAASATIASIDRSVAVFDRFTSDGKSDDRYLLGGAILTAVSNRAVRAALRCNVCWSQGDPHCGSGPLRRVDSHSEDD